MLTRKKAEAFKCLVYFLRSQDMTCIFQAVNQHPHMLSVVSQPTYSRPSSLTRRKSLSHLVDAWGSHPSEKSAAETQYKISLSSLNQTSHPSLLYKSHFFLRSLHRLWYASDLAIARNDQSVVPPVSRLLVHRRYYLHRRCRHPSRYSNVPSHSVERLPVAAEHGNRYVRNDVPFALPLLEMIPK